VIVGAQPPATAVGRAHPAMQPHRRLAGLRLIAFAALGLYGVLRWGTMLSPNPTDRLLALLCIAVSVAALGLLPARLQPLWRRTLTALGLLAGLIGVLAASGLPLELIAHARVALAARRIGEGLDGLPGVLVPYGGADAPLREVILMGAGVLLLDGAAMLALSSAPLGELRLAVAALPLAVLALVPAALARPALPYLQGAVLFVLLALFVLGGRLRRGAAPALAAATVAGMALAPLLNQPRPWLDFEQLTSELAASQGETFDWSQSYGPLRWPTNGLTVLSVNAPRPSYWKAEDQDVFDGYRWTAAGAPGAPTQPGWWLRYLPRRAYADYRETITVRVRDMSSRQLIFAGSPLGPPSGLGGLVAPNPAGTMMLSSPRLSPGRSYRITVYAPDPSAAQLRNDPPRYPAAISAAFLQVQIPSARAPAQRATVSFAPFGTHAAPRLVHAGAQPGRSASAAPAAPSTPPFSTPSASSTPAAFSALAASPYAQVYALARRLARSAATPYAFAAAIERHLQRGFTYTSDPPGARYPLATFLLSTHAGYCQQFAGAMALLLRMGGVPARVVSGFETGTRGGSHTWLVSDLDAHSWVQAWFSGYGWVTFDPTPAGSSGDGLSPIAGTSVSAAGSSAPSRAQPSAASASARTGRRSAGASAFARRRGRGSVPPAALAAAAVALLVAVALGLIAVGARTGDDDPVAELSRAFARAGRPLARNTTLAALEQRLREQPEAAAYVRALRLRRFAARPAPISGAQRRALRRALAAGGGVRGRLRALWALPPRPRRNAARAPSARDSHRLD